MNTLKTLICALALIIASGCGDALDIDDPPQWLCPNEETCTEDCPVTAERSFQLACTEIGGDDGTTISLSVTHTITNTDEFPLDRVQVHSQYLDSDVTLDQFSPQSDFSNPGPGAVDYYVLLEDLQPGESATLSYQRIFDDRTPGGPRPVVVEDLSLCIPGRAVVRMDSESIEWDAQ